MDPDSEIITNTAVTAGNAGDATAAEALLADVLESEAKRLGMAETSPTPSSTDIAAQASAAAGFDEPKAQVYGDASYGTADLVERLEGADVEV